MLSQILLDGLAKSCIYAAVAVGFSLVYNTTRIFHICYSVLYVFAGYMLFTFCNMIGSGLLLCFVLAILATAILSVLIELAVYRPLSRRGSSSAVILVSSIGAMVVVTNVLVILYGSDTKVVSRELSSAMLFGGLQLTMNQIAQIVISLLTIALVFCFLKFTRFGLQARALRDDPTLCSVFGIDAYKLRTILFAMSGALAAVSSGSVTYDLGIGPFDGMKMLLNAVVALIIGGMGRFESPVIGAFVIGTIQSFVIWRFSTRWEDAVTFVLLIAFLMVRPKGILGEKPREV